MTATHLIVDGFGCPSEKLNNEEAIRELLTDLPLTIGMTPIYGTLRIVTFEAVKPEDSGVSGQLMIAESHIAVHTFPSIDAFMLDVVSCRPFNSAVALEVIRKHMRPRNVSWQTPTRRILLPSLVRVLTA